MSLKTEHMRVDPHDALREQASSDRAMPRPDWEGRRLLAVFGVSLCAISLVIAGHARGKAQELAAAEAAQDAEKAAIASEFTQWQAARGEDGMVDGIPVARLKPGRQSGADMQVVSADLSDLVDYDFTEIEIARVKADERRCMAEALYYESRNESIMGKLGVADVVLNRVDSSYWPDTICGVVYQGSHRTTGCQFSFTCDGSMDRGRNQALYEELDELAGVILAGMHMPVSRDATHYHADYVSPYWAPSMTPTASIGAHKFYRLPNKDTKTVVSAAQ